MTISRTSILVAATNTLERLWTFYRLLLRRYWGRRLFYILALNCIASIAVMLLNWKGTSRVDWQSLLAVFARVFIFSNSIGMLVAAGCDFVLHLRTRINFALFPLLFMAVTFVQTTLGLLLGGLLVVAFGLLDAAKLWTQFYSSLLTAVMVSAVFGAIGLLYSTLITRAEATAKLLQAKELEHERASKLAAEAQLALLQSKMQPHFIFNTLNTVAELIREDPEQAEQTIGQLAKLLRAVLYTDRSSLVPLAAELQLVRDYLAIEKARLGKRFRYAIEVPANFSQVMIPPFAVQTIVENSIKHVVSKRFADNEIRITARADGDKLFLEISDNGPGFDQNQIVAGHGLDNIRARLAALFHDQAELNVNCDHNGTNILLVLPGLNDELEAAA